MNFQAKSSIKEKAKGHTGVALRSVFLAVLTMLLLISQQSSLKAADPAKGQQLFKDNCARCHSPALEKASTGPALMGVMDRIPEGDWIYKWVKNSMKLRQEGDAYAIKIYNDNAKAPMDPMPHLTDGDIDDIMVWVGAYAPAVVVADEGEALDPAKQKALDSLWNWLRLLLFVVLILLANIALKVARLRGVEFFAGINLDKLNARLMLAFFVLGMIGTVWSIGVFRPYFLLDNSASDHGREIDQLFWMTMVVVFGVFVITNAVLFYFAYKYGKDGGRKAKYYPENHKLELIWTVVPAIVLSVLIIFGIRVWTNVMSPPDPNLETVHIEVSGQQWGWILRYPGDDQKFGKINVHLIGGDNILGVDYKDQVSHDDFIANDLVFPKGVTIDLKIRSRDVLHSVYLPHFRVKMDAVPGMDTRFHFVANQTTEEYREALKSNSMWNAIDTIVQREIKVGDSLPGGTMATVGKIWSDTIRKADSFDFELACTEVCGRGHFSMRKKVIVMEPEDYKKWLAEAKKTPLYNAALHDVSKEIPTIADRKEPGSKQN